MTKPLKLLAVAAVVAGLGNAANAATIHTLTFEEFPVGTVITNQYAGLGIVFSPGANGNFPIIANDGAMPDSPVLSPNPPYAGSFDFEFTRSTDFVRFTSGFWDSIGSGDIDVFDRDGNLLASLTNSGTGSETFEISGLGLIGRIVFDSSADPAGADIGTLSFNVPEPGTLLLLGAGLFGLAGPRLRLVGKRK